MSLAGGIDATGPGGPGGPAAATLAAEPPVDAAAGRRLTPQTPPEAPATLARRWWRRHRLVPLILAAIALVAVLMAVTTGSGHGGDLDPQSATPAGSRALATLLHARGVSVVRVPTTDDALARAGDQPVTVFVPMPGLYDDLDLLDRLPAGSTIVLAAPDGDAVRALSDIYRSGGSVSTRSRDPGCDVGAATTAGSVTAGGMTYAGGDATCYDGVLATQADPHHRVVVFGTTEPFTNDALGHDGNAALALGLLGEHPDLVWLLARPGELAAADGTGRPGLMHFLPARLKLAVWQAVIAVALLMLWRARRLGPVVSEPLPVVVRAAEAVEGRGRLYHAARARGRAARALREAARARLRGPLGLGRDASADALTAAAAERTGRAPAAVGSLLYGADPTDDRELVALAGELDTLEAEVRRS